MNRTPWEIELVAQELLEALEYVLETHVYAGNDGMDAERKARAAIAKAKGE